MDYITFFKGLAEKEVDYLLVGGLAVNFHGIPRMTYDIDIMILLTERNLEKLVDLLVHWGYRPRLPEDPYRLLDEAMREKWLKEKGMMAFTFWSDESTVREVDLVFHCPAPYEDLKRRSVKMELDDIPVPVISIGDLIEMKCRSERQQDISDIEHLKRLLTP